MVTEEVFVNFYNFNPITKSQKRKCSMCLINLSGAGAEIRIWGSKEPEPKEIFSAPQHMHYCTNVDLLIGALLKPPFILVQEQTKKLVSVSLPVPEQAKFEVKSWHVNCTRSLLFLFKSACCLDFVISRNVCTIACFESNSFLMESFGP
jgi:hypothetical protein